MVADGNLTDVLADSCYSSIVSLQGFCLLIWQDCCDVEPRRVVAGAGRGRRPCHGRLSEATREATRACARGSACESAPQRPCVFGPALRHEVRVALAREPPGAPARSVVERAAQSSAPRLVIEMGLLELVHAAPMKPLGELVERLRALEQGGET